MHLKNPLKIPPSIGQILLAKGVFFCYYTNVVFLKILVRQEVRRWQSVISAVRVFILETTLAIPIEDPIISGSPM